MSDRLGKCYELAGKRIASSPWQIEPVLVHGIIRNEVGDVCHAWVETDGDRVWEPTTNTVYDIIEFRVLFNPWQLARYPARQARQLMYDNGNWGPWDSASEDWYRWYRDNPFVDHKHLSHQATAIVIGES